MVIDSRTNHRELRAVGRVLRFAAERLAWNVFVMFAVVSGVVVAAIIVTSQTILRYWA